MHELSIALNIVEAAAAEANRRGLGRVVAVRVRVGRLSGVVDEALLAAWEFACEGSPLAGSRLCVETVEARAYCPTCQAERVIDPAGAFCCEACGTPTPRVVAGRELELSALEVETT